MELPCDILAKFVKGIEYKKKDDIEEIVFKVNRKFLNQNSIEHNSLPYIILSWGIHAGTRLKIIMSLNAYFNILYDKRIRLTFPDNAKINKDEYSWERIKIKLDNIETDLSHIHENNMITSINFTNAIIPCEKRRGLWDSTVTQLMDEQLLLWEFIFRCNRNTEYTALPFDEYMCEEKFPIYSEIYKMMQRGLEYAQDNFYAEYKQDESELIRYIVFQNTIVPFMLYNSIIKKHNYKPEDYDLENIKKIIETADLDGLEDVESFIKEHSSKLADADIYKDFLYNPFFESDLIKLKTAEIMENLIKTSEIYIKLLAAKFCKDDLNDKEIGNKFHIFELIFNNIWEVFTFAIQKNIIFTTEYGCDTANFFNLRKFMLIRYLLQECKRYLPNLTYFDEKIDIINTLIRKNNITFEEEIEKYHYNIARYMDSMCDENDDTYSNGKIHKCEHINIEIHNFIRIMKSSKKTFWTEETYDDMCEIVNFNTPLVLIKAPWVLYHIFKKNTIT